MKVALGILAAVVGMAWLGGCADTRRVRVRNQERPYQKNSRVQWGSSALESLCDIDKADVQRTRDGRLRIRLAIRNRTSHDLWVDVRTLFTDADGFECEKTNWEPVCLTAKTHTMYEVVSLNSRVADYQIIIRDPRRFEALP